MTGEVRLGNNWIITLCIKYSQLEYYDPMSKNLLYILLLKSMKDAGIMFVLFARDYSCWNKAVIRISWGLTPCKHCALLHGWRVTLLFFQSTRTATDTHGQAGDSFCEWLWYVLVAYKVTLYLTNQGEHLALRDFRCCRGCPRIYTEELRDHHSLAVRIATKSSLEGESHHKRLINTPCIAAGSQSQPRSSCLERAEMGCGWAGPWSRILLASYSGRRGRRGKELGLSPPCCFAAATSVALCCAQSYRAGCHNQG